MKNGFRNPRSASWKNLDSYFNALSSLSGLTFSKHSDAFLTTLSVAYQHLQQMLIAEPANLISSLKSAHKAYFEFVRGGPDPSSSLSNVDPASLSFILGSMGTASGQAVAAITLPFIRLRRVLYGTNGAPDLVTFDRLVLAFLNLHRLIILPPVYDFSTITDPFFTPPTPNESNTDPNGKLLPSAATFTPEKPITDDEIRTALLALGITPSSFKNEYSRLADAQEHELFSTAGPNGAATWTAYADAIAILANETITKYLHTFAEKSGLSRFWDSLLATVRLDDRDPILRSTPILGKIYSFEEWGGKTRHVAILDYWTQIILTPLHKAIFHFLRAIPMDATFDQDSAVRDIQAWTSTKFAELYSIDLTAATDRLPIALQQRILGILLSDSALAHAWVQILTARDFETHDGSTVRYSVGQPMGARSSWAMLALTHHVIIQIAAIRADYTLTSEQLLSTSAPKTVIRAGTPTEGAYTAYKVCGDDSTLAGNPVYIQYLLIMNDLRVTINTTKSVLFSSTLLNAAEFCKRLFIGGLEYSSISPKLVIKTVQNGRLAPTLQSDLQRRGYVFPGTTLISWLAGLIDAESLDFLLVMNMLPTSITGLHSRAALPASDMRLETLLGDGYPLNENDFIQAYTYVASVGQLKRIDALLQQTRTVYEMIENAMTGLLRPTVPMSETTTDTGLAALYRQLAQSASSLSPSHPIFEAANAEAARITNLLSQLSTGTTDLGTAARARVLDMFRNALASAWQDTDAARAQADRSLIQGALTHLGQLVAKSVDHATNPRLFGAPILSFTTLLAHIRRLWTINWRLGDTVRINTVKSNVTASSLDASTRVAVALRAGSITSRYMVSPKSKPSS